MIVLRSIIFNILFYLVLVLFLLLGSPVLLMPRIYAIRALQAWGRVSNWLLRVICKVHIEVRGRENLVDAPMLVAGKHQSAWETFAIPALLNDPCMVLKRELFYIPIYGWPYAFKFKMIGVDRSGGSKSLKDLIARGREEVACGRQIVIMPEGTRKAIGAPPDYKPGAAALYTGLNVPCVPFGLNAGLFWPRRKFLRYPGTIIIEFGKAIPAGLPRKEFQKQLQETVEEITNRLILEK
jgi:1-acyl-sn-glycerol-3-phosphate acyltransferase